ncbi:unnamed protein product [Rotaria sp. Silwood1]|nr:unnamed protein product [Rotaria sp. Silwood1]
MNSSEITKLLRTKPNKYVIKDYTSKNATSSCWSTFGLPAEIIDETTNEFKIIDGFASSKVCFTTFVFRSGSKGTSTKNLTDHNLPKTTDAIKPNRKRKREAESDQTDSDEFDDEFDDQCTDPLHEVVLTINKCKKMVRYVRKTGLDRKIQEKGGLCLVQENQARWLSLYAMLNSIDRSYDILIVILSEMNVLHLVTSVDRKLLNVRPIIF